MSSKYVQMIKLYKQYRYHNVKTAQHFAFHSLGFFISHLDIKIFFACMQSITLYDLPSSVPNLSCITTLPLLLGVNVILSYPLAPTSPPATLSSNYTQKNDS